MRKEIIGNHTLYLGDCFDILPYISQVDAVITDPPYGIVNKYKSLKSKAQHGTRTLSFKFDGIEDSKEYNNKVYDIIRYCSLIIKHNIFVFCGTSQISHIEEILHNFGMTAKAFSWIKKIAPPPAPNNRWPSSFEIGIFGYKKSAYFGDKNTKRRNIYISDTYRHGIRRHEKVDHPTQKWLPLLEHLVLSLVPSFGYCLDPFMGSGTTGVACENLGRKFIGIEISEKYFDIACKRIEAAVRNKQFEISPANAHIRAHEVMV